MPFNAAILLFTLAFGLWPSLGLGSALDSGATTESIPQPLFRPTLTLKLAKELRTLKETKPQSTIMSSNSEDSQPGPVETSTTPASQSVQPVGSADEILRQAELHWQQGEIDQAEALYKAFLDLFPYHPHNHLIMVRLADMLQRKQRLEDALKLYDKITTTYPATQGAVISQIRMADLGMKSPKLLPDAVKPHFEHYNDPVRSLQKLVQSYPTNPLADIARFKIADFKLQRGELKEALVLLRQLAQKGLAPSLMMLVQDKLGQLLQRLLETQQAQEAYTDVLKTFYSHRPLLSRLNMTNPHLIFPVATSYARLGLASEAESLLQWLLTVGPSDLSTPNEGAKQDNIQPLRNPVTPNAKGLSHTETASIRTKILLLLGELAMQANQPAKAMTYLGSANPSVLQAPERIRLYAWLAESYLAQGDRSNGLKMLQTCEDLPNDDDKQPFPELEMCLFRAAHLMFEANQYPAALQRYQQLLQVFPQTRHGEQALFHLALIYQELGKASETVQTLGRLREVSTDSLWQKVAADFLSHLTWQKGLHERLATLQKEPVQ